jgi:hypothetical protein
MIVNKNFARLLLVASVMALPWGQIAAEELFKYQDTMIHGMPSAELSLPLEECRNVCLARSGCAGFVHAEAAKTCQMFASVDGAADSSGNAAETRVPIKGYRDPLNPPDLAELCAQKASPRIGSKGVLYDGIDSREAIEVCGKAATSVGAKPETFAYFARALERAGRAAETIEWAKRSAEAGNAAGQWYLGSLYEDGKFVDHEKDKAAILYMKSAAQGYPLGQYRFARLLESGGIFGQDPQRAVELYRRAGDQGYGPASLRLGSIYQTGSGVQKDNNEALRLYRQAERQGIADASGRIESICTHNETLRC